MSQSTADSGGGSIEDLLPRLYEELRELASRAMRREVVGHTLQATAVVHEAYLRLAGQRNLLEADRTRLLAAAATIIRRILVDHARARDAHKRGGLVERVTLSGVDVVAAHDSAGGFEAAPGEPGEVDVLALNAALDDLAALGPRAAKVVEMRYFAGMTVDQVAAELGVSPRTVASEWVFAKAWLKRELERRAATASAAGPGVPRPRTA